MSIHVGADGTIELSGNCPVEDAELLLQQLLDNPRAPVAWRACESAHAAVIQVLLVARVAPTGTPISPFLRDKVAPLLQRQSEGSLSNSLLYNTDL